MHNQRGVYREQALNCIFSILNTKRVNECFFRHSIEALLNLTYFLRHCFSTIHLLDKNLSAPFLCLKCLKKFELESSQIGNQSNRPLSPLPQIPLTGNQESNEIKCWNKYLQSQSDFCMYILTDRD